EGDDTEEKLSCIAGGRGVEAELDCKRGQRLPADLNLRRRFGKDPGCRECFALEQPHEIGSANDEIEVVTDCAFQDDIRGLAARERSLAPDLNRLPYIGEAAFQNGAIQVGLRAVEVARRPARDPGFLTDLAQAGGFVSLLGKESFGRVEDGFASAG